MVTGVVPSSPRFLLSIFTAHRVQQSHSSSTFDRVLLTHALALSASQFVHETKSRQMYTSMRSGGLELAKLIYTRLEDNLIRHRGHRYLHVYRGSGLIAQCLNLRDKKRGLSTKRLHTVYCCSAAAGSTDRPPGANNRRKNNISPAVQPEPSGQDEGTTDAGARRLEGYQ